MTRPDSPDRATFWLLLLCLGLCAGMLLGLLWGAA